MREARLAGLSVAEGNRAKNFTREGSGRSKMVGGDGEGSTATASPSGTCTRRPQRHTGAAAAAKPSQRPATRRHV